MFRRALRGGLPPRMCGLSRNLRGRIIPIVMGGPPTRISLRETSRLPGPYVPRKQTRGKRGEPSSSTNHSEGGIDSPLPGGRCCSPEGVLVCMHRSLQ